MTVKELTGESFDKETSNDKAVVDFWAEWCGPCKMSKPIFEALSEEQKGINFFSVNVDNHPEIPAKFSVMGIPTFILLKDGKEADRIVGSLDKEAFKAKLLQAFK